MEELTEQRDRLRDKLETEAAVRADLEPLRALEQEAARLTAERDALKPDAEAYARFRERLGAIECEARQRAAGLEDEAGIRLRRLTDQFQTQYRALMSTFETTAAHVNSELRKIEVNLTQLPRAMDQSGAELKELEALKMHPREQEGPRTLIARGERLYAMTVGQMREQVAQILDWYQLQLSTQESLRIAKASRRTAACFDQAEAYVGLDDLPPLALDPPAGHAEDA